MAGCLMNAAAWLPSAEIINNGKPALFLGGSSASLQDMYCKCSCLECQASPSPTTAPAHPGRIMNLLSFYRHTQGDAQQDAAPAASAPDGAAAPDGAQPTGDKGEADDALAEVAACWRSLVYKSSFNAQEIKLRQHAIEVAGSQGGRLLVGKKLFVYHFPTGVETQPLLRGGWMRGGIKCYLEDTGEYLITYDNRTTDTLYLGLNFTHFSTRPPLPGTQPQLLPTSDPCPGGGKRKRPTTSTPEEEAIATLAARRGVIPRPHVGPSQPPANPAAPLGPPGAAHPPHPGYPGVAASTLQQRLQARPGLQHLHDADDETTVSEHRDDDPGDSAVSSRPSGDPQHQAPSPVRPPRMGPAAGAAALSASRLGVGSAGAGLGGGGGPAGAPPPAVPYGYGTAGVAYPQAAPHGAPQTSAAPPAGAASHPSTNTAPPATSLPSTSPTATTSAPVSPLGNCRPPVVPTPQEILALASSGTWPAGLDLATLAANTSPSTLAAGFRLLQQTAAAAAASGNPRAAWLGNALQQTDLAALQQQLNDWPPQRKHLPS